MQRVDRIDDRNTRGRHALFAKRPIHVEDGERERDTGEAIAQAFRTAEERRNELSESIRLDGVEAPADAETLEHGGGAAAEATAELEDRRRTRIHPGLDRSRADAVVQGVECVVVRKVVGPQRQPRWGEQDPLARPFPAQERRIVARGGFGDGVRG